MEPIDLRPKKTEKADMPTIGGDCCPSVYLNGPKDLADLPKEGYVTFKYKRVEMAVRDREERPVSVTLSLKEIVEATEEEEELEGTEAESEDDESEMDAGEILDRRMKKAISEEEIED